MSQSKAKAVLAHYGSRDCALTWGDESLWDSAKLYLGWIYD